MPASRSRVDEARYLFYAFKSWRDLLLRDFFSMCSLLPLCVCPDLDGFVLSAFDSAWPSPKVPFTTAPLCPKFLTLAPDEQGLQKLGAFLVQLGAIQAAGDGELENTIGGSSFLVGCVSH